MQLRPIFTSPAIITEPWDMQKPGPMLAVVGDLHLPEDDVQPVEQPRQDGHVVLTQPALAAGR